MLDIENKTRSELIAEIERLQKIVLQLRSKEENTKIAITFFDDIRNDQQIQKQSLDTLIYLEKVFHLSPLGTLILDMNGKAIIVNPAYLKLFNTSAKNVINHYNIVHDKALNQQGFGPTIKRVLEEGERANFELEYAIEQGGNAQFQKTASKYLNLIITPILNDRKDPTNILVQIIDLTEKKRAEEQIRQSKSIMQASIDSAQGVWFSCVDRNYRFLYFNIPYAMWAQHRYKVKLEIGDSLIDMITDKEDIQSICDQALSGKSHVEIVSRFRNNKTVYYEVRYNPVYNEKNEIIAISFLAQNITKRMEAESALKESEGYLKKAQNIAHVGHIKYNPKSNEMEGSDELYAIYGLNREDNSFDDFMDIVHPQDRDLVVSKLDAAINKGKGYEIVNRLLLKNGIEKYVKVIVEPVLNADHTTEFIIGTVQDISDIKRAEQALQESEILHRTMITNIADVISIVALDGKFRYNSPNIQKWFGWNPQELVGTEGCELIHPDDYEQVKKEYTACINSESTAIKTMQYRMRRKDGSYRFIETTIVNLTQDPIVKGILTTFHDITERKKADEERVKLEEQLHQTEKMRVIGQLAGGIAHDFNNQLAGILGYADILRLKIGTNSKLIEYIDKISISVQRSADLTSQLLAFSRQGKYQEVIVDIHHIIQEVSSLLTHSIDKLVMIQLQLQANPSSVSGDPTQIQNMLLNLALNARDAMPNGGLLTMSTQIVTIDKPIFKKNNFQMRQGVFIQISVSDTGIGIDQEIQERIFEPFFTTKEQGKGIGMGLAAVFGTVKNHNGFIDFYSEPGKGSIFKVYLPVASPSHSVDMMKESEKMTPLKFGSGTILVVEDDESLREISTDILNNLGYKVMACANGEEALALYKKAWMDIDLVILDIVMPLLGGRDTFLAMRQINPNIIVLLASGFSIDGEAQQILDQGAQGFIQKPFDSVTLGEKIAQLLDKSATGKS